MNKEEILEMSRNENRNRDEMEKDVQAKAGQAACAAGGIVCALIIILESFFSAEVNMGTWAVYLTMTGTMLLTKYFRLKKKHELIFGLLQLVLAGVFLVLFVMKLMRGQHG